MTIVPEQAGAAHKETCHEPCQRTIAAAAVVGSLLTGGAMGATLFSAGRATAATATTTPASGGSAATAPAASGGSAFHSNEDATHEAGESAAREAEENNGTATYGPMPAPAAGASPSA